MQSPKQQLEKLFRTAVDAASPARTIPPHLPPPPLGTTYVAGAGKAAALMAQTVENHWQSPIGGTVITRYGHGAQTRKIRVVEAGHPVPDEAGQQATAEILRDVGGLGGDDLLICVFSGGGSSLMALPAPGLTLADKRAINHALLRSGATIHEMNIVRKHLSAIKGGRLAMASGAPLMTLIISDVPGDDPSVIASGPTVADGSRSTDALDILARYDVDVPLHVLAHLKSEASESPKPGHPAFDRAEVRMISTPRQALLAACDAARAAGLNPILLGDAIEGEARSVARDHAAAARQARPGTLFLSGGETTVTMAGGGHGGRNSEFLLALAIELDDRPDTYALAADTDGIDGSEDNAGAYIDPTTLKRARVLGLDPRAMLADNDSYSFFSRLGDLVMTGPTRTNVNDFRAILIL